MFRGATSLSLDAKSRLAIPSRHRDALAAEADGRVVLTAHPHRCLLLYPQPAWEPIQARVMSLSSFDPHSSALQRILVGHAEDIDLDSSGRVLISSVLREVAGLDKQVMLVGQGSHFEIWSMENWKSQMEKSLTGASMNLPAELEGFSL